MTRLDKCPFCGGEPNLYWGRITGDCWAYIVCDCGAKTRNFHGESDKEASKKAADMWNTRVNGSETAETSDNAHLRTCKNNAPSYLDFLCSECGFVNYHSEANDTGEGNEWNYCPNCGARVTPKCSETTQKEVEE